MYYLKSGYSELSLDLSTWLAGVRREKGNSCKVQKASTHVVIFSLYL